ncbi:STAS domain-containing protein [Vibrio sp. TRT 21S02]|uniref:STAS domain-containing protein n=1 Tax=unclassified Vibrio TaxID=2614977 RepID=UPI00349F5FC0
MQQIYQLPEELTIYEVGDVHQQIKGILSEGDALVLDGALVEVLDSAGYQLLIWFIRYAERQGMATPIIKPSEQIIKYGELLQCPAILECKPQ